LQSLLVGGERFGYIGTGITMGGDVNLGWETYEFIQRSQRSSYLEQSRVGNTLSSVARGKEGIGAKEDIIRR